MDFISEDKKTINLPVPLGTTLYQFHTTCNDACMFQFERFYEIFPPKEGGLCSGDMPCHTTLHSIRSFELSLSNMIFVLDTWGKITFETENEARKAGERTVEQHKQQLLRLGLEIE